MLWFSRGYGNSWMELLIFLLPAALAFAVYVLPWTESMGSP